MVRDLVFIEHIGEVDIYNEATGTVEKINDYEQAKAAIKKARPELTDDNFRIVHSKQPEKVNQENSTSMVEITIHEGKNHQVKRMFESVGFHVEKLTRERIGIFDINNLKSGQYRKLTPKEVQIVYSYKN